MDPPGTFIGSYEDRRGRFAVSSAVSTAQEARKAAWEGA